MAQGTCNILQNKAPYTFEGECSGFLSISRGRQYPICTNLIKKMYTNPQ